MSGAIERLEKLRAYLRHGGWTRYSSNGPLEVWHRGEEYVNLFEDDGPRGEAAFAEAVAHVAQAEGRTADLVLNSLTTLRVGRMDVFFDGRPVTTQGIEVQFAIKALDELRKLVEVVYDVNRRGLVKSSGRYGATPDILLTGVARGSFGFRLVEDSGNSLPLFDDETELAQSIDQAAELLGTVVGGGLEARLAELEPRVVTNLRSFIKRIRIGGATVRIVVPRMDCKLREADIEQAARILTHTSQRVRHHDYEGRFMGSLLRARTFEFDATQEIIEGHVTPLESAPRPLDGKVDPSVPEDVLKDWMHRVDSTQRVRIRRITTITSSNTRIADRLVAVWAPNEETPPPPEVEVELEEDPDYENLDANSP